MTTLEAYLKSLLIAAVPDLYIVILEDDTHGYDPVSTRELLEHLVNESCSGIRPPITVALS